MLTLLRTKEIHFQAGADAGKTTAILGHLSVCQGTLEQGIIHVNAQSVNQGQLTPLPHVHV